MSAAVSPFSVTCPTCLAPVGQPCMNIWTKQAIEYAHIERRIAAAVHHEKVRVIVAIDTGMSLAELRALLAAETENL